MKNIGKYTVISRLGAGGFGAVFLAEDKLGQKVAIKVMRVMDKQLAKQLHSTMGKDALRQLRQRFINEAKILRQLSSNPHIVDMYDFDMLEDGSPYYVMPALGRSLEKYLGKDVFTQGGLEEVPPEQHPKRLSVAQGRQYLEQILEGLSAVHAAGLVHRDIKPANILFDEQGNVQLCDFGIAKTPDSGLTETSMVIGTRLYMSPEQRESTKHVAPQSDVYSVALLAYRMFSGTVPQLAQRRLLELAPEVGAPLSDVIMAALNPDPAQRPPDATAFLAAVKKSAAPAGASQTGGSQRQQRTGTGAAKTPGKSGAPSGLTTPILAMSVALAVMGGGYWLYSEMRSAESQIEQVAQEQSRRDDMAFQLARSRNTREAYLEYKRNWPRGQHYDAANSAIAALASAQSSAASDAAPAPVAQITQPTPAAQLSLRAARDCSAAIEREDYARAATVCEDGSAEDQNSLGDAYDYGTGVTRDHAEAVRWYRLAAEQGDATAQHNLGYAYSYARGVSQDYAEAVKWYRRAAQQGYASAQNSLGFAYDRGRGVAQNYDEAAKWYRRAADGGNSSAQNNLGYAYDHGLGVPQDYSLAIRWYRTAADAGNASAQNNLGYAYDHGNGVGQDHVEAVKWFRLAANQGNASAQYNLAFAYEKGRGVKQDYVAALDWYRKAADNGDVSALNSIGDAYDYGQGVTRDQAEAVKWYLKAANKGNATAQNNLGYAYANGRGVTQDYAEALKWYRKSAEQGNTSAQNNLGYAYANGRGTAQNYSEAIKWYRRAADQGSGSAQNNLGYAYDHGQGVTQDHEEAVRWFRRAADAGNASGQYNLGFAYDNGRGVGRDRSEALRWYRIAADNGSTTAKQVMCDDYGESRYCGG